ncbi:PQQ-dependent sugar dehydrogenase [Pseudidiomarina halophila]|uniref:PQQ-dependent sugar dehydrogenase n=1 Tax=Pseudidiomarina halophila TaxID=1449799 RepID=UPI001F54775B|nr:PQQ-dependent sugar dehydrogenase [Pseudidiomarina halophila]
MIGLNKVLMAGVAACAVFLTPLTSAQDPADFEVMVIANDLTHPWSLVELPEQPLNFLVTERDGGFKLVSELGFIDEIPLELPGLFVTGQAGLFAVSLAPDFESSRELYFSYACGVANANTTCVARGTLSRTRPLKVSDVKQIYVAQSLREGGAHYGGRMVWLPDDTLVLTLGDGFDYREEAQNLQNHFGKIVRMTRDGEPAADNPFPHKAGGYIYSYGHRNSQGLVYDSEADNLWQHEHGPRGGDELNRIQPGKNYGWPIASYGIDYTGALVTPYEELPGVAMPEYQWTPSLAPADMVLYRGSEFPEWQGALLVTHLAGKRMQVLKQSANGWEVVHEIKLAEQQRLRAVTGASDGAIYLLTDSPQGQLLRLSRAEN